MRLKVWLLVAATLITSVVLSQSAFAAKVLQMKGQRLLIDLEGDSANVGDKYFVMIGEKKRGLITITKVKNSKALATLNKGKAEVNAPLQFAKAGNGGGSSSSHHTTHSQRYWGLMAGYSMDSQTAKLADSTHTTSQNTSMSGTGYSLLGFAEIPYSGNLGFMARGGFEMFNVKGTTTVAFPCSGSSTDCHTKLTYLTLDALLRYKFGSGRLTPWAGAGVGIYYPLSKDTTALSPDIGMSTVLLIDGGINYALSSTSYIPIIAEYAWFPPSPDVSTHIIAVRIGYGMTF